MRRRNVPCSPCSGGTSSGDCCGLKEKLRILWDRTIGSILRINGISPDGDGDFTIEAGDNIQLTERGTGNGIRIDTTGGVSYYSSGDSYVNVDNNDLEISVNVGTGGLATDTDLQTVAEAVADILDGTSTVPEATHATSADSATNATNATNAQYLGNSTSNVGTDTKPIKIVNGQAVAVTDDLWKKQTPTIDKHSAYCNNFIMIGEKLALCWGFIAITWSNTVQRFSVNLPVTANSADNIYPILQRAMNDGTWWSEVHLNIEGARRTTTSFDIDTYSNKSGDSGSGYAHYVVLVPIA